MFYFIEDFPHVEDNTRTVIISNKIIGKKSLLKCYNDKLLFPDFFGYNYDAFYDCMVQLNCYFPEQEVKICHESLPSLNDKDMQIYLDTLNQVDVEWERDTERIELFQQYARNHPDKVITGGASCDNYSSKIFNVYFRKRDESFVKDILYQYSWDYRKCMQFDVTGMIDIKYTDRYPRD